MIEMFTMVAKKKLRASEIKQADSKVPQQKCEEFDFSKYTAPEKYLNYHRFSSSIDVLQFWYLVLLNLLKKWDSSGLRLEPGTYHNAESGIKIY